MPKTEEIVDYLRAHPTFFDDHQELLTEMDLSSTQGSAPFHERQLQVLRERESAQKARLDLIVDSAKANQQLEEGLHRLSIRFISRCHNDAASEENLAELVKTGFDIDKVAVFLEQGSRPDIGGIDYDHLSQRVAHLGSICDDRLSSSFIKSLFGEQDYGIQSCAFIPLCYANNLKGVLVLGSVNEDRFKPGIGVMFLDRLGQLCSAYLEQSLSGNSSF